MSNILPSKPDGLNLADLNPRRPAQYVSADTQRILQGEYGDDVIGVATTLFETAIATGNTAHIDHAVFALSAGAIPVAKQTRADLLLSFVPGYTALAQDRLPSTAELAEIKADTARTLADAAEFLLTEDVDSIAKKYGVSFKDAAKVLHDRQGDNGDALVHHLQLHNSLNGQGDAAIPASRRQDTTLPFAREFSRLVLDSFRPHDPEDPDNQDVIGIKTRRGKRGSGKWDTQQITLLPRGTDALKAATGATDGEIQRPMVEDLTMRVLSAESHIHGNEENIAVRDHLAAAVRRAYDAGHLFPLQNGQ